MSKARHKQKWPRKAPDDAEGPSVKVAFYAQYYCFTLGDALLHICPLPWELDGSLDGFNTSVHGKDHVIFEHLGDLLGKSAKDAVVERSRGKGELLGLLNEGSNDARVTMTLIVDISKNLWMEV